MYSHMRAFALHHGTVMKFILVTWCVMSSALIFATFAQVTNIACSDGVIGSQYSNFVVQIANCSATSVHLKGTIVNTTILLQDIDQFLLSGSGVTLNSVQIWISNCFSTTNANGAFSILDSSTLINVSIYTQNTSLADGFQFAKGCTIDSLNLRHVNSVVTTIIPDDGHLVYLGLGTMRNVSLYLENITAVTTAYASSSMLTFSKGCTISGLRVVGRNLALTSISPGDAIVAISTTTMTTATFTFENVTIVGAALPNSIVFPARNTFIVAINGSSLHNVSISFRKLEAFGITSGIGVTSSTMTNCTLLMDSVNTTVRGVTLPALIALTAGTVISRSTWAISNVSMIGTYTGTTISGGSASEQQAALIITMNATQISSWIFSLSQSNVSLFAHDPFGFAALDSSLSDSLLTFGPQLNLTMGLPETSTSGIGGITFGVTTTTVFSSQLVIDTSWIQSTMNNTNAGTMASDVTSIGGILHNFFISMIDSRFATATTGISLPNSTVRNMSVIVLRSNMTTVSSAWATHNTTLDTLSITILSSGLTMISDQDTESMFLPHLIAFDKSNVTNAVITIGSRSRIVATSVTAVAVVSVIAIVSSNLMNVSFLITSASTVDVLTDTIDCTVTSAMVVSNTTWEGGSIGFTDSTVRIASTVISSLLSATPISIRRVSIIVQNCTVSLTAHNFTIPDHLPSALVFMLTQDGKDASVLGLWDETNFTVSSSNLSLTSEPSGSSITNSKGSSSGLFFFNQTVLSNSVVIMKRSNFVAQHSWIQSFPNSTTNFSKTTFQICDNSVISLNGTTGIIVAFVLFSLYTDPLTTFSITNSAVSILHRSSEAANLGVFLVRKMAYQPCVVQSRFDFNNAVISVTQASDVGTGHTSAVPTSSSMIQGCVYGFYGAGDSVITMQDVSLSIVNNTRIFISGADSASLFPSTNALVRNVTLTISNSLVQLSSSGKKICLTAFVVLNMTAVESMVLHVSASTVAFLIDPGNSTSLDVIGCGLLVLQTCNVTTFNVELATSTLSMSAVSPSRTSKTFNTFGLLIVSGAFIHQLTVSFSSSTNVSVACSECNAIFMARGNASVDVNTVQFNVHSGSSVSLNVTPAANASANSSMSTVDKLIASPGSLANIAGMYLSPNASLNSFVVDIDGGSSIFISSQITFGVLAIGSAATIGLTTRITDRSMFTMRGSVFSFFVGGFSGSSFPHTIFNVSQSSTVLIDADGGSAQASALFFLQDALAVETILLLSNASRLWLTANTSNIASGNACIATVASFVNATATNLRILVDGVNSSLQIRAANSVGVLMFLQGNRTLVNNSLIQIQRNASLIINSSSVGPPFNLMNISKQGEFLSSVRGIACYAFSAAALSIGDRVEVSEGSTFSLSGTLVVWYLLYTSTLLNATMIALAASKVSLTAVSLASTVTAVFGLGATVKDLQFLVHSTSTMVLASGTSTSTIKTTTPSTSNFVIFSMFADSGNITAFTIAISQGGSLLLLGQSSVMALQLVQGNVNVSGIAISLTSSSELSLSQSSGNLTQLMVLFSALTTSDSSDFSVSDLAGLSALVVVVGSAISGLLIAVNDNSIISVTAPLVSYFFAIGPVITTTNFQGGANNVSLHATDASQLICTAAMIAAPFLIAKNYTVSNIDIRLIDDASMQLYGGNQSATSAISLNSSLSPSTFTSLLTSGATAVMFAVSAPLTNVSFIVSSSKVTAKGSVSSLSFLLSSSAKHVDIQVVCGATIRMRALGLSSPLAIVLSTVVGLSILIDNASTVEQSIPLDGSNVNNRVALVFLASSSLSGLRFVTSGYSHITALCSRCTMAVLLFAQSTVTDTFWQLANNSMITLNCTIGVTSANLPKSGGTPVMDPNTIMMSLLSPTSPEKSFAAVLSAISATLNMTKMRFDNHTNVYLSGSVAAVVSLLGDAVLDTFVTETTAGCRFECVVGQGTPTTSTTADFNSGIIGAVVASMGATFLNATFLFSNATIVVDVAKGLFGAPFLVDSSVVQGLQITVTDESQWTSVVHASPSVSLTFVFFGFSFTVPFQLPTFASILYLQSSHNVNHTPLNEGTLSLSILKHSVVSVYCPQAIQQSGSPITVSISSSLGYIDIYNVDFVHLHWNLDETSSLLLSVFGDASSSSSSSSVLDTSAFKSGMKVDWATMSISVDLKGTLMMTPTASVILLPNTSVTGGNVAFNGTELVVVVVAADGGPPTTAATLMIPLVTFSGSSTATNMNFSFTELERLESSPPLLQANANSYIVNVTAHISQSNFTASDVTSALTISQAGNLVVYLSRNQFRHVEPSSLSASVALQSPSSSSGAIRVWHTNIPISVSGGGGGGGRSPASGGAIRFVLDSNDFFGWRNVFDLRSDFAAYQGDFIDSHCTTYLMNRHAWDQKTVPMTTKNLISSFLQFGNTALWNGEQCLGSQTASSTATQDATRTRTVSLSSTRSLSPSATITNATSVTTTATDVLSPTKETNTITQTFTQTFSIKPPTPTVSLYVAQRPCPTIIIQTIPPILTDAIIRQHPTVLNITLPHGIRWWNRPWSYDGINYFSFHVVIASQPQPTGFSQYIKEAGVLLNASSTWAFTGSPLYNSITVTLPAASTYEILFPEKISLTFEPHALQFQCAGTNPATGYFDVLPEASVALVDAATYTASAAVISALLGFGTSSVDAQLLFILAGTECSSAAQFSTTGSLNAYLLSPFFYSGLEWMIYGNVLLVLGIAALQALLVGLLFMSKFRRMVGQELPREPTAHDTEKHIANRLDYIVVAAMTLQCPALTYAAAVILIPGIILASLKLIVQGDGGARSVIAIIVAPIFVVGFGRTWLRAMGVLDRLLKAGKIHPMAQRNFVPVFKPYTQFDEYNFFWRTINPLGRWGPRQQTAMFGKYFGAMSGDYPTMGPYPLFMLLVSSIIAVIPFHGTVGCTTQFALIGIPPFVAGFFVLVRRPFRVPAVSYCSGVIHLIAGVVAIITAILSSGQTSIFLQLLQIGLSTVSSCAVALRFLINARITYCENFLWKDVEFSIENIFAAALEALIGDSGGDIFGSGKAKKKRKARLEKLETSSSSSNHDDEFELNITPPRSAAEIHADMAASNLKKIDALHNVLDILKCGPPPHFQDVVARLAQLVRLASLEKQYKSLLVELQRTGAWIPCDVVDEEDLANI